MRDFYFGGHSTDATDHVIVVSDSEALESPVAIAQQLLQLAQLLRGKSLLWKESKSSEKFTEKDLEATGDEQFSKNASLLRTPKRCSINHWSVKHLGL